MSEHSKHSSTQPVSTAYLGTEASHYDVKRFHDAAGQSVHATELGLFTQVLQILPARARVLEVGCGTGRFLLEACRRGMSGHGVDPSEDMLSETRRKIAPDFPDIVLRTAEGTKLPFAPGTFDLVYSIRVLNQTESEAYALAMIPEMLRVAKPGGLTLVEFRSAHRPAFTPHREVRLRVERVLAAATAAGGRRVWFRGAFLLGMTAYYRAPTVLRPLVAVADRLLSRLAPRWCSRCYLLLRKAEVRG